MKQSLLRIISLASLGLLLHAPGFAQQIEEDTLIAPKGKEEIVIRHKSDKDAKVTIEIKDNKVYVNGKPVEEFENDDLSIRKMKMDLFDGRTLTLDGMNMSPFRSQGGGWSFDSDMAPKKAGSHAFLGVTSEEPADAAGARITSISDTSAAEKCGLKKGDIITKIDDMTIDAPQDLSKAIGKYKPGEKITITYKRDGKEQKATATLGKNRILARSFSFSSDPDMIVEGFKGMGPMAPMPPGSYNFNYDRSSKLGIRAQDTEDGKGVKVLNVDEDSRAEKAGIKEGDIITRFDNTEVNSAETLARIANAAKVKPAVHVNILREGKPMEFDIKTPKKLKTADL